MGGGEGGFCASTTPCVDSGCGRVADASVRSWQVAVRLGIRVEKQAV